VHQGSTEPDAGHYRHNRHTDGGWATPRTIDAIEALLPPPNGRAVVRPFRVVN